MSTFNRNSIPSTSYNRTDDYLIVNYYDGNGSYRTSKSKVESISVNLATDELYGGVRLGFPEETAEKNQYALKVDADGNGYFNVYWTDNVIISAQYMPELSAIRIVVDGTERKVIDIDISEFIDDYNGDGRTVECNNNIFSIKEGAFLLSGNYAHTDDSNNGDVLYVSDGGQKFEQILKQVQSEEDITENGRMYYLSSDGRMIFRSNGSSITLKTPTQD